ncbi:unnamed protein product [Rotaria magnacalcarata]|uniref:Uncharacterized protein n=1 Tax=Rotaria magnacalcarata TaxID=392030 RepID=A0A815W160_9BILA|nr:unnamed protein product [Rotaria magnacalcarata]CAF3922019.1 unnamed protein product [Rotaria magnacalcarata]
MGGHALKNVVTRRYARNEYYILKERILNKLQGRIDQFDVPREFPCKESFGDIDVLMVCQSSMNIRNLIEELFNPNEIVKNGDVYSFDFEQFQVDFILVPEEQFDNATVYLSYSDLGGLIGNICHKIGLKHGVQGLWMNVHTQEFDPTTTSTKLILSRNVKEIFDFLGYNYEQYMKGFDSENDFFQWIIDGKYFRDVYFDDQQLNHAHRQRTSKRPIYIKFREYLNQLSKSEINESSQDHKEFIRNIRQQALIYFKKEEDYHQGLCQREEKRQLKDKYNGRYFCDIDDGTHMIRVHMKNFEKRFGKTDEEFHQWIVNTDHDTIKLEIEKYKNEIKHNQSS